MKYSFEALPLRPAVPAGADADFLIYTIVKQAAGARQMIEQAHTTFLAQQ